MGIPKFLGATIIVLWLAVKVTFGAIAFCVAANVALAHHSYAMFDKRKSVDVEGSVAKVEWVNPHVFVWMYVKKADKPGEYDLYAF